MKWESFCYFVFHLSPSFYYSAKHVLTAECTLQCWETLEITPLFHAFFYFYFFISGYNVSIEKQRLSGKLQSQAVAVVLKIKL